MVHSSEDLTIEAHRVFGKCLRSAEINEVIFLDLKLISQAGLFK